MLLYEFWGLTQIMLKLSVIGQTQFLGMEMWGRAEMPLLCAVYSREPEAQHRPVEAALS